MAEGTPEAIAKNKESFAGEYLKLLLEATTLLSKSIDAIVAT